MQGHELGIAMMPAVVLGIDTPIGLAIIRDLGSRDVPVHGIARSADAIGIASRFLTKAHIRADGNEAIIEQLVSLGKTLGHACLFAISESDIGFLNVYRERLTGYKLMFADAERMESVLNKEQTYLAAQKVAIRVPRTEQVQSLAEADALCQSLRYPVVLKWSNPNDVTKQLSAVGLALDKAHYCYSAGDLMTYLSPYDAVGLFPLIQEYCAGFGLGQIVLMHEGRARYTFQHKRLHEWPPEGGFSTLCESVGPQQNAALMTKSIELLAELKWDGIAMVEYRHDPATGESAFMEINGRFWGSLPLACHAGASFPWLMYNLAGLGRDIELLPYSNHLRCRFMIPETKRLLRVLFQDKAIADRRLKFNRISEVLRFFGDFIRPKTCYYVMDFRDPMPFFHDTTQLIKKALALRSRR